MFLNISGGAIASLWPH